MEAYEEDLARRKEIQRELKLKEHIELTRKLVEEARREEEKRLEDLAARAAEAEAERERERQEFIHQKMLQRHFINSSELRDQRWRARTIDRKRVNLVQIENNRRRQEWVNFSERSIDFVKRKKKRIFKHGIFFIMKISNYYYHSCKFFLFIFSTTL